MPHAAADQRREEAARDWGCGLNGALQPRFSEQHGVNIEWLLEGKGRVFKNDLEERQP